MASCLQLLQVQSCTVQKHNSFAVRGYPEGRQERVRHDVSQCSSVLTSDSQQLSTCCGPGLGRFSDRLTDRFQCSLLQAEEVKRAADQVAQLRRVGKGLGVFEFDRSLAAAVGVDAVEAD